MTEQGKAPAAQTADEAILNRAIAALTANEALEKENTFLRGELLSASVALNIAVGYLVGLGRPQEAAQMDGWRHRAYQATLQAASQSEPAEGRPSHEVPEIPPPSDSKG